jgi:hypothetical protein
MFEVNMKRHRKVTSPIRIVVVCSLSIVAGALTSAGCNSGEETVPDAAGTGGLATGVGGTGVVLGGTTGAGTTSTPAGGVPGTSTAGSVSTGGITPAAGSSSGGVGTAGMPGGGTGGAAGTGGSGGGATSDLTDAVKGWMGWRFEMPCGTYPGGQPLDDACTRDNICWVGTDSVAPYKTSKELVMGGDPTKVYEFQIHARGVIEPKVHSGCQRLTQPVEGTGGIAICKGGGDSQSGFNLWSLNIADPPQVFWMNDSDTDTHRTNILDGTFTVQARGQTKVTFNFDDKNTGEINNGCPAFRKVIAGVKPFPGYFTGNFFQLDVVDGSVKIVP